MTPAAAQAERWREVEARVPDAQRGDPEAIRAVEGFSDWHMIRRTGIGGSDVAAVLGLHREERPIDVWLKKTGRAPEREETEPQRWGKLLEPTIALEYARRHDVELVGPLVTQRHPARPWHLYTIDRAVWARGAYERVVEIKARGFWASRDYGDEGTDEVPAPDVCQTHWYMSGLGVDRSDLVALFNTWSLREFSIVRDAELEAELIERAGAWWQRHVVEDVEPEPDGSKAYAEHLRRRYAQTLGDFVPVTPELEPLLEQLRVVECVYKRIGEHRELLRQRLQVAIGEHDGIELGAGRGRVTHRVQKGRVRESAVVAELAARLEMGPKQLAGLKDQHRGEPIRPLLMPAPWRGDELVGLAPELDAKLRALTEGGR